MFKIRNFFILIACLGFSFPVQSLAADKATTEVGIGFAEESSSSTIDSTTDDSKKEIPKTGDSKTAEPGNQQQKVNNVSRTTTKYGTSARNEKGILPKTGEQQTRWLLFLGFGCVTAVFWLVLYSRFKKEGKHE